MWRNSLGASLRYCVYESGTDNPKKMSLTETRRGKLKTYLKVSKNFTLKTHKCTYSYNLFCNSGAALSKQDKNNPLWCHNGSHIQMFYRTPKLQAGHVEFKRWRCLQVMEGLIKDTAELHYGKCRTECFWSLIHLGTKTPTTKSFKPSNFIIGLPI